LLNRTDQNWQRGRPSQAEIDAFWEKRLQPAITVSFAHRKGGVGVSRPGAFCPVIHGNGKRSGRPSQKYVRAPIYRWLRCGDGTSFERSIPRGSTPEIASLPAPYSLPGHDRWLPESEPERLPPTKPQPASILIYRQIHATGFYLVRLCRQLVNDEPIDPLLKAAKAEAERRYCEAVPEAGFTRRHPRISDHAERRLRGKCNSEIRRAIRRAEKTRAGLSLSDDRAIEKQLRRIFRHKVKRLDRELKHDFGWTDSVVPRDWPMRWIHGLYAPIVTPHWWLPKRKRRTLDETEAGSTVGWARFAADLGAPHNAKLLAAAERKQRRADTMIEVLIRRNARRNDPRPPHGSGQFWGFSGIMNMRIGK
jgi:hypothetical protein